MWQNKLFFLFIATTSFIKGMVFLEGTMADPVLSTTSKENIANDTGAVVFACPQCGYEHIVRSSSERKNVVQYTCPKCGFTGPN